MPRIINHTPERAPMTSMQHERAAPERWEDEMARRHRTHRRIEVAILMVIVFLTTIWIAAR